MVAVTSGHPALVIEHLLGEPGYHQGPVLLVALAGDKRQQPLWLYWEQFRVGRGKVTQGCCSGRRALICTHLPLLIPETPKLVLPESHSPYLNAPW